MSNNDIKPNAFISGSMVYGTPDSDSDLDLVVLLDVKTQEELRLLMKDNSSIQFGDLTLLAFKDEKSFKLWKTVTLELQSKKPVSRDYAIKVFQINGFKKY